MILQIFFESNLDFFSSQHKHKLRHVGENVIKQKFLAGAGKKIFSSPGKFSSSFSFFKNFIQSSQKLKHILKLPIQKIFS
jgi:hypothetical protein